MTKEDLFENIKRKRSFLCVGLDTDVRRLPEHLQHEDDPIFEFNRRIIDATAEYCIAYKPNLAFYESMGAFGIQAFDKTVSYLREKYPDQLIIADAKRGDIGNTSSMYARSFFENSHVDAITVSPYMGSDSVSPFLLYPGKWVILLALTSNQGSADFQMMQDEKGEYLFERVLRISKTWENSEQLMYVVGATKAQMLERVRAIVPDSFLLVPGIGSQNGSLEEVVKYGLNKTCGLIVNASRSIIYADNTESFALYAAEEAGKLRRQMEDALIKNNII
ncbi:orotidine-5'-phosphate decarboxylase [Porphyromonas macacae]|uniref:Orotidine 5'-phosphate decarboxylase n=1 Tax=Porphyromonas macacae TaxID=28115 RepID=A0A379DFT6_9PORP|nr:orotidine-5'-phosphate decarboxylase [Porphyromonas macacae]SUB76903.1 orotidine 5'-phosphate decarboxylase [Porphyromonas macacae]